MLLVWLVVTILFVLVEVRPGDASDTFITSDFEQELQEKLRESWRLDDPAHLRYLAMLGNLARGEFGYSFQASGRSEHTRVSNRIQACLPRTLAVAGVPLILIFAFGTGIGTWQAASRTRWVDPLLGMSTLVTYALPRFWLALLLLYLFYFRLGWFSMFTETGEPSLDRYLLAWVAMTIPGSAVVARFVRSRIKEVLQRDHVRFALAHGLTWPRVVLLHALPNALLPLIGLLGVSLPVLVSGSVVVEQVFSLPGMGMLIVEAIQVQDTPTIVGCFFVYSLAVVAGNLLADGLAALADPRLRAS